MGSGKSYLGSEMAAQMDQKFYDLDEEIEHEQKCSIIKIFSEKGESHFRDLESELLCGWEKSGVVATGGGIIERECNRNFLKNNDHITIWLNPDWPEILKNLPRSSDRPLFNRMSERELYLLWQRRLPYYKECADIVVNDPDLDKLMRRIKI